MAKEEAPKARVSSKLEVGTVVQQCFLTILSIVVQPGVSCLAQHSLDGCVQEAVLAIHLRRKEA